MLNANCEPGPAHSLLHPCAPSSLPKSSGTLPLPEGETGSRGCPRAQSWEAAELGFGPRQFLVPKAPAATPHWLGWAMHPSTRPCTQASAPPLPGDLLPPPPPPPVSSWLDPLDSHPPHPLSPWGPISPPHLSPLTVLPWNPETCPSLRAELVLPHQARSTLRALLCLLHQTLGSLAQRHYPTPRFRQPHTVRGPGMSC